MGEVRFGPARVPSRDSPEAAVELLLERGYSACEIDFEGKFWMDYPWAERFGVLARENSIALSVHAPIAGFVGHAERGKKLNMAIGMLDHSAGIAVAASAELVVFHPGFSWAGSGSRRSTTWSSRPASCGSGWRRRTAVSPSASRSWAASASWAPSTTCSSLPHACRGSARCSTSPMHATSDGAFTEAAFASVLERADDVIEPGAPFHVHFSGHRLREPERDEALELRRRHAARGAAGRGAGPLRPPCDRDQRVSQ